MYDEAESAQPSTVVVDDDEPTNPSDESDESDNSDDSDDSDSSDNSDNSDSSDGSDSSGDDGEDDTSLDDQTTPYEEPYTGGDDDAQPGSDDGQSIPSGSDITVHDFLTAKQLPGVYVKGYIVGSCTKNKGNADLTQPFAHATALLLADSPEEKDVDKMMSLELKSGSKIREALNLVDHPELYQHKLKVFGYRTSYLGMYGIKGATSWELDW